MVKRVFSETAGFRSSAIGALMALLLAVLDYDASNYACLGL